MYIASLRLAVALVCVGVSLILSGQWFGFVPDPMFAMMQARQSKCEAIAINAAAHIRRQQWIDLESTLRTLVERDENLLSIGLRTQVGRLRVDTGHHEGIWPKEAGASPNVDTLAVPITLNRRHWGQVEFCFHREDLSKLELALQQPIYRIAIYFACAGLLSYTIFVARIMGVFSSTQVVPDRVRQALDTLAEGLLVLDENQRIVLANKAFSETVGISAESLHGQAVGDLPWIYSAEDVDELPWVKAGESGEMQTDTMLRYERESGEQRIFSVNSAPLGAEGDRRGSLATFRDVTHVEQHRVELEKMLLMLRSSRDEISRKNRELEILATQDSLTGCLNRRAFFERFAKHWNDSQAKESPLACVMIDNDHFKSVNDTYGHHIGDEVLRRVSKVVREMYEEPDLVCRFGGEEFVVLLPGRTLEQAQVEAERIRLAICDVRLTDPAELRLTASLGVSEKSLGAASPQDMINEADACLYVAKRGGRNQVVAYDPSMANMEIDESKVSRTKESETPTASIPFQAVTALVSALSYRDTSTAEHSRRVADLCVKAADGLLDQRSTYILEIGGLLHDIGKIGVPDSVLLKPGPLTAEEWQLMGRHDAIGVEIVNGTFECKELTELIRTHHAFYGGKARDPHLPSGEEIPLAARLLTIADSYDAMVSDRVYRKGRSHEEAIAELRRCAGTQFDPTLVEHFATKVTDRMVANTSLEANVPKHVAIQIGLQIERLADAIDSQDASTLKSLVGRLGTMATECQIESIASSAQRISAQINASENVEWLSVLEETQQLLEYCRATQNAFLQGSGDPASSHQES